MKIVGLIIFLLTVQTGFAMDISLGKMKCDGSAYSRLDDGNFAFERFTTVYTPTRSQRLYIAKNRYNPLRFEFERVEENIASPMVIMATDPDEVLFHRGYSSRTWNQDMREFKFDKPTMFKFRDRAVLGFNLVCRM